MALISAGDLALLRGDSRSEYFLSPWVPITLWTARVNNGAIARGDETVAFNTGAGGHWVAVEEHQTVWVGSAAGLHDIGKVRIKSVSSGDAGTTGTLVVNRNGLDWSHADYLTFLHDVEIWPVQNLVDTNEVFYKDWEVDGGITYTDENEPPSRPITIGGPHVQAKFLSGGTVRFTIPVGHSYRIDSVVPQLDNHAVTVYPMVGVTINAYAAQAITIDITQAGYYMARVYVENKTSGESQVTFRKLIVHEDDPSSANYPFVDMSSITVNGDWGSGGWKAVVRCNKGASISKIPDGTAALLWRRTYFGSTQKTITILTNYGVQDNGTVINGFVRKDTVTMDQGDATLPRGTVSFEITTVQNLLTAKPMFSVPLEVNDSPSTWWQYQNGYLDWAHIIYYLYRWHSTLFHTHDVLGLLNIDITSPDPPQRKAIDFQKGSLYQMGNEFINKRGVLYRLTCDKTGRFYAAWDLTLEQDALRGFITEYAKIIEADTVGPVTFVRAPEERTSFLFFSGVGYDGATATPIGSTSPGETMGHTGGKDVQVPYQMMETDGPDAQSYSNRKCGQLYATLNNEWPEVRIKFAGDYLNVFEPAVTGWWKIDVASGDTPKGFVWTDKNMCLRRVSAKINLPSGTMTIDGIFEPEVDGTDGVPYQFPGVAPTPGGSIPVPTAVPGYAIMTGASINYLPGGSSTWSQRIADAMNGVAQDPYWRTAAKQDTDDPAQAILFSAESGQIRRSTNTGTSWSTLSPGNPPNDAGDAPAPVLANLDFTDVEGSVVEDGEFAWMARWQNGAGDWRTWLLFTDDDGATFSWRSMGTFDYLSGTATDVEAVNGQVVGYGIAAVPSVALTSTKTIVLRRNGGGAANFTAFLLTIAASPATTVTVEDSVVLTDGSFPCNFNPGIVRVSDTEAIVFGPWWSAVPANDRIVAYLLTVSGGNTLTITDTDASAAGTAYSVDTLNTTGAARLSSTVARFVYLANTDNDINSIRATLSGSTITIGTADTVVTYNVGVTEPHFPSLCPLTSTTCVMLYHELITQRWHALLFTDSGFSVDDDIIIDTVDGPAAKAEASHNGRDKISKISSTKAVVVYPRSSGEKRVLIITESSGNLSAGTPTQLTVANPTNAGIAVLSVARAMISYVNTGSQLRVLEMSLSSTTVTEGSDALASTGVSFLTAGTSIIDNLDGRYTIMYSANGVHGWLFVGGEDASFDVKGAGLSIGRGDGDKLYATAWANGLLEIKQYALPLAAPRSQSLGAASLAQFDSRTFWARPFAVDGDDDYLAIYGRMSDPGGLGIYHLLWSADAAVSVIPAENGFGTSYVGAMCSDYYGNVYAIANVPGASPKLYATIPGLGLSLLSTAPIDGGVEPRAVTANWTGNVIFGVDAGKAIMVVYSPSPYVRWFDITGNHSTASGINKVEVL